MKRLFTLCLALTAMTLGAMAAEELYVGGKKVTLSGSGTVTVSGGDIKSGSVEYDCTSKTLTLTATEKKLVELYRKADSGTKKAAMNLLKGEGNALELFGTLLTGKKEVSSMAGDLLGSLLSGKGEGSTTKGPGEEAEECTEQG